MSTETGVIVVAGLSLGGLMSYAPIEGVTMGQILLGCVCYMAGAVGSIGVYIRSRTEAQQPVDYGVVWSNLLSSFLMALIATIVILALCDLAGVGNDLAKAAFLGIVGFGGTTGLDIVVQMAMRIMKTLIGTKEEPKP